MNLIDLARKFLKEQFELENRNCVILDGTYEDSDGAEGFVLYIGDVVMFVSNDGYIAFHDKRQFDENIPTEDLLHEMTGRVIESAIYY